MRIIGFRAEEGKSGGEKNKNDEKWNFDDVETKLAQQEHEREEQLKVTQKDKLLCAAILSNKEGEIYKRAMHETDATVTPDIYEAAIDKFARGDVTEDMKRDMLMEVTMEHAKNVDALSEKLSSEADRKILAEMSAPGLEGGADSIRSIIEQYPTPREFEEATDAYLKNLTDDEFALVKPAMENLESTVYGKRYEYNQRLKEIEEEARKRGEVLEKERSKEWVPGAESHFKISREQIAHLSKEGSLEGLKEDENGMDFLIHDSGRQLYGIFDGYENSPGVSGSKAAEYARDAVVQLDKKYGVNDCSSLSACLAVSSDLVHDAPGAGFTSGTIAKVVEVEKHPYLAYATLGDSHLYIVDKTGAAREITKAYDKNDGKVDMMGFSGDNKTSEIVRYDQVPLEKGDCVVMCTDNIIGRNKEFNTLEKFGRFVHDSHGPEDAVSRLSMAALNAGVKDDCAVSVFVPKIN